MRLALLTLLLALTADAAKTCASTADCPNPFACTAGFCQCPPGTFTWESGGVVRCRLCAAGCACPGGIYACGGCSGGAYSPLPGAAACTPCGAGTTTDSNFNSGCDPQSYATPCANDKGPLGWTACRPTPPAQNAAPNASFAPFSGTAFAPPQYMAPRATTEMYVTVPGFAAVPVTFVELPVTNGAGTATFTIPALPSNPIVVRLADTGGLGGTIAVPSFAESDLPVASFNAAVAGQPNLQPSYAPPGPPFVPNQVPPYYDVPPEGEKPKPMLQGSY